MSVALIVVPEIKDELMKKGKKQNRGTNKSYRGQPEVSPLWQSETF